MEPINLPNIITQSFTQVNDENNNQQEDVQVWPDLQKCDPNVAVGLLNRHVAKLERDGKLQKCDDDKKPEPIKYSPPYYPKLSLRQLLGPKKKKASTVKAPRTKKATSYMARAVVHHKPGYYKPMSPSELADHKIANALHYKELMSLKAAFKNQQG